MTSFTLGSLTFSAYGTAVALSAAVGLLLGWLMTRRAGLKPGTASWFGVLSVPLGVLCSRLVYCLVRLPWFLSKGIGWFFRFSEGGFTLLGTLCGAALAAWLTARITRQSFGRLIDALAAPGALTIGLCRLAEFFAGEGYGWPVEDWFSVDAFDAEEYTGMSLFHLEDASFFERFPFSVQDHYRQYCWAVFVIEALLMLVIFLVLLGTREGRPGWRGLWFLAMLFPAQVLGESLRQDSVLRWGFVRCFQVLGGVGLGLLLLGLCLALPKEKRKAGPIILAWVGMLLCMGLVMAMEFALEKKIVFLEAMPMDVCYVIMAAACAGIALFIRPLWEKSNVTVQG